MKKIYTALVIIFVSMRAQAQVLESDSLALVALYNSTNGNAWTDNTNWLTDAVPTWFGVTVSGNRVVKLELCTNCYVSSVGNNLQGTIPAAIGDLTELTNLALPASQLTGSIPTEIGNLTKMQYLILSSNKLTGPIPSSIGNLTQLDNLILAANELDGPLPPALFNTQIGNLSIASNKFSGSIPPEIGNASNLKYIQASSNQFTGELPKEIGNCTNLLMISLENNQLTGSIPSEIGNLTSMFGLYMQNNQLSGDLPSTIGNLTALSALNLYGNSFTGSIPKEIGNLTNLTYLYLYSNQLTGSIPSEIGNLTKLQSLVLYRNNLSGNIPASLGNLTSLQSLSLYFNHLTGTIPASLGDIKTFDSFDVSYNELTGALPAGFSNMPVIRYISMENNQIEDLPDLSANTTLQSVTVQNNYLSYSDLEPNIGVTGLSYLPQSTLLPPAGFITLNEGDTFATSYSVDGAFTQYQWARGSINISGATSATLTIPDVTPDDDGAYTVTVTNSKVTGLFFTTNPYSLTVIPKNVTAPQLVITRNSVAVIDNDEFTFAASESKQFVIENTGDASLEITNVTIVDDFTTTLTFPLSIPAGGNLGFEVTFNTTTEGNHTGALTLATNAGDFTMNLNGKFTIVKRSISGSNVTFSLTNVGDESVQTFTLVNTGNATINILSVDVTGPFAITSPSVDSIAVGKNASFSIAFTPDHIGEHTGSITVTTDGDSPVVTFNIVGMGEADIEVYNLVTTHQNGKNDYLNIRNIALFPNNTIQIFDRWGNSVYTKTGYDNVSDTFKGVSDKGKSLPDGTYFYMIDKKNGSDPVTGFILVRN